MQHTPNPLNFVSGSRISRRWSLGGWWPACHSLCFQAGQVLLNSKPRCLPYQHTTPISIAIHMLIFIQELNSTDLAWPISLGWWDHSPERYGCRPVRKQMSAIDTTHWYFIPFIIYLIHTPGQLRFCYCELCTNIFINKVCLRITGETPLPGDMITASSLLQEEDCLNNVWVFFFFFPLSWFVLRKFLILW